MSARVWLCVVAGAALLSCPSGFNPTAARPYPCDPTVSSSSQCATGWRCGLEKICHDESVAGPYLCTSDRDCELSWTCNTIAGHCQAPIDDGLRAGYSLGALLPERIHPIQGWGLPEEIGVSLPETSTVGGVNGNQQTIQSVATWSDGGLSLWSRTLRAPPQNLGIYLWNQATVPVPERPDELAMTFDTAWLLRDGGLDVYPMGGANFSFLAPWSHVRATCGRPDCDVVGFTPGDVPVAIFSLDGGSIPSVSPFGPTPVVDVVSSEFSYDAGVLIATRSGVQQLWTSPLNSCPANAVVPPGIGSVLRLRPWHNRALAIESANLDGGTPVLSLVQPPSPGASPCDPGPWVPAFVGCSECPSGTLIDFLPIVVGLGQPQIQMRCALGGGVVQTWQLAQLFPGPACQPPQLISPLAASSPALFEEPATLDQSTAPATCGIASPHGSLWVEALDGGAYSQSEGFEGFSGSLQFMSGEGQNLIGMENNRIFFWTCEDGFRLSTSGSPFSAVLAQVENAPHWVLLGEPTPSVFALPTDQPTNCSAQDGKTAPALSAEIVMLAAGASGSFANTGTASLATTASGRQFLIVTGDDAIFSTELSAPDAGPAQWSVRAVPSTLDSIVSSTTTANDDDAGLVDFQGYVTTASGGLFSFAGTSEEKRWATQELIVAGSPNKVWSDGARGRAGFSDGTVLALPSQLPIAAAIDGGVADFAQFCGTTVALTGGGPVWLASNPDGGRLGTWSPLALSTPMPGGFVPPGATTAGFETGRLHVGGDELYVISSLGPVFRLSADGGCP